MAMGKNNQGVQKLLSLMRKLIREVNDKEICNKLEILVSSEKEDIPANMVKDLLESPLSFDASQIPEPYTQYVKHYIYMVKREIRLNQKKEALKTQRAKKTSKKSSTKKSKASKKSRKTKNKS